MKAGVFLTALFGLVIFSVGLTQAALELKEGERPQFLDIFLHAPTEANLRVFERDLEDASWFAQKLRSSMQYLQFVVQKDLGENALVGRDGWLFYKPGVRYLIEAWNGNRGVLDSIVDFRDQLAARGIRLLVVPAPGKASVYPQMLTSRARNAMAPVNKHTLELLDGLREAGVEVVDLSARFAQTGASGQASAGTTCYLSQDTHWSPKGVRLAAKAVARKLLGLGWVNEGDVPYELRPVAIRRHGDILKMMQAPRIQRCFAPEEVDCTQVVRRDTGEPYKDDANSEVLVLGDSFLRIYERDEPGAGGFIAHLARELGLPLASIVNDGGASTLVRQELNRKSELLENKKVVVWEFVERDIRFGAEGWQKVPLPKPIS